MTPEMHMVAICREMGWSYYDYMEQPTWFIDLLSEQIKIDNKKAKREEDKIRRQSNK